MSNKNIARKQTLTQDIKQLIHSAKDKAVGAVDFERVLLYWNIDKMIFEEEQSGKERADYGKEVIKELAGDLDSVYGSGYSYRQLYLCLQFFRAFPIANAMRSQLNWTQYRLPIQINGEK